MRILSSRLKLRLHMRISFLILSNLFDELTISIPYGTVSQVQSIPHTIC